MFIWNSDTEPKSTAWLHIHEHPDHGFVLEWALSLPGDPNGQLLNTVGDASLLTEGDWIDAADECFVLVGNFVPLETAWAIIEDFFADPLSPSKRAQWIDVEDMPERPVP